MRPIRGRDAIESEFEALDDALDRELAVYLLGGGAMTFRGLKDATRDLDLLVGGRASFERLRNCLYERDYERVENPVDADASPGAAVVLDREGACRFDVFDREVVRKLRLSEGMKDRATEVFAGASLRVHALSDEDVFLFKGVAGRSRDLDDVTDLVRSGRGLDFDVITEEFQAQFPTNTGAVEFELLRDAPENHPVITVERTVLSLPMTLPDSFTSVVRAEADRVHAEFALVGELDGEATVGALTDVLTSRNAVEVDGREDVAAAVDSLVEKEVVVRDGDTVRFREFDAGS
jgi:molybdopterin converting factor small subunit